MFLPRFSFIIYKRAFSLQLTHISSQHIDQSRQIIRSMVVKQFNNKNNHYLKARITSVHEINGILMKSKNLCVPLEEVKIHVPLSPQRIHCVLGPISRALLQTPNNKPLIRHSPESEWLRESLL